MQLILSSEYRLWLCQFDATTQGLNAGPFYFTKKFYHIWHPLMKTRIGATAKFQQ
jgi:hypothetical protein